MKEIVKNGNISNIFILHSLNGDTLEIWGKNLKETFEEKGIEVYMPIFPIRAKSKYERFREILNNYLDNEKLNNNSIVICHSIGNAYFIKYCKDMNYIPKVYIAVAPSGIYDYPMNRNDYIIEVLKQSYCQKEELNFIKENIKNKYCLYSDEADNNTEKFTKFIEDTGSKDKYLKNYKHFDGYNKICEVPELTKLIEDLL